MSVTSELNGLNKTVSGFVKGAALCAQNTLTMSLCVSTYFHEFINCSIDPDKIQVNTILKQLV